MDEQPIVEPLSVEEKMDAYRIARNFQDDKVEVLKRLRELVGNSRLHLAIQCLVEITK